MLNGKEIYPLEVKLERLVSGLIRVFTHIPKDKKERMDWAFLIIAITMNVMSVAAILVALIIRSS